MLEFETVCRVGLRFLWPVGPGLYTREWVILQPVPAGMCTASRLRPGRAQGCYFSHRLRQLTTPALLLKAEPELPVRGFSALLLPGHFFPSPPGPRASRSGRQCVSRGRDPASQASSVTGGPQSSVASGPRSGWAASTARLPVAGSLLRLHGGLGYLSGQCSHPFPASCYWLFSQFASLRELGKDRLRDSLGPGPRTLPRSQGYSRRAEMAPALSLRIQPRVDKNTRTFITTGSEAVWQRVR